MRGAVVILKDRSRSVGSCSANQAHIAACQRWSQGRSLAASVVKHWNALREQCSRSRRPAGGLGSACFKPFHAGLKQGHVRFEGADALIELGE